MTHTRRTVRTMLLGLLLGMLAAGAGAQTPFTQNDLAGSGLVQNYTPPAGQDALAQLGANSYIAMGTNPVAGQPNSTIQVAPTRNNAEASPVPLPGADCQAQGKLYFGGSPPDYTVVGVGFADNPASFGDGRGYFGEVAYNAGAYTVQIERVDDVASNTRTILVAAAIPTPAAGSIGQIALEVRPGGVFALSYTPSAGPVVTTTATDGTFAVSRAAIQEQCNSSGLMNIGLGSFSAVQVATATAQTFPLTSVSRWGGWTVDQGSPLTTGMTNRESQLAFTFTGTKAEILQAAPNGQVSYDGYSVSVDGGAPTLVVPTVAQSWLTLASGLTDGVQHKMVESIHYTAYDNSFGWNLDCTTPVRITGAAPACSPYTGGRTSFDGPLDTRTTPYVNAAVFDGDSRTFGTGNSIAGQSGLAYQGNTYPAKFFSTYLDSTWLPVNQGTYSDFASHMLARQASDVLTQFKSTNARNVLFFWGGINDLDTNVSAATLGQTVRSYMAAARAAGVKERIIGTLPYTYQVSAQGSAIQQQIEAYNADLRANWRAIGATALAEVDKDPAFASHATTSDWNQDGLHFSDSGYVKIAADFHTAFITQVFPSPLALSVTVSAAGAAFAAVPNFGTGPYTYTLSRPGMTAVTNTSGSLTDASPVAGVLNLYTVSATDSSPTPITQTVTQAVAPIGASSIVSGTKRKVQ